MANPKKIIDWDMVNNLCKIQCTAVEIASLVDCCTQTLDRHIKETFKMSTVEYIRQKSAGGKASLRRMQYKCAEGGNATMLIWLGKQYLDQCDVKDITIDATVKSGVQEVLETLATLEQTNDEETT